MTTLTQDLVQYIRQKKVSQVDLDQAALFVLDAVASGVAGKRSNAGYILSKWAGAQGGDAGRQAFLFGALTHILEMDDIHRASVTHPGCVVVPTALVVGLREGSSGHDILHSVLHGYEAMCRVGMAVGQAHYRIWHNTSTCGPFGSAMAASTLIQLTDEQAVHALGNAGTQSSGLWEFNRTGSMSKHMHAGRAVESGITAADLAKHGFTGPPQILEGPQGFFAGTCPDAIPEALLNHPSEPWQLTLTSVKPWPSCRHTHAAIDAALALNKKLDGRDIRKVKVSIYQTVLDVCDQPNPTTDYQAKFSIYHCVAAALAEGRVEFSSFDEKHRNSLADLRSKVVAEVEEPYASAYPDQYWGAKVSVTLGDGSIIEEERHECKGDPEAALTTDEMITKAEMLLVHGGIERADTKSLMDSILNLAQNRVEHDILEKNILGR